MTISLSARSAILALCYGLLMMPVVARQKTPAVMRLICKDTVWAIADCPVKLPDEIVNWKPGYKYKLELFKDSNCEQLVEHLDSIGVLKDTLDKAYEIVRREEAAQRNAGFAGWYRHHIEVTILPPGTWYLMRTVDGSSLATGSPKIVREYWVLHVKQPALVPVLDSLYFYGESAFFNFQSGHPDYQKYSYDILRVIREDSIGTRRGEGASVTVIGKDSIAIIGKGKGALVTLDSVALNIENFTEEIGKVRNFIIRGYYDGRLFTYRNMLDSSISLSAWSFKLKKPKLECLTQWGVKGAKPLGTEENALDVRSSWPYEPRAFRFMFIGQKQSKFIMTQPIITNLKVVSTTPSDFQSGKPIVVDNSPWSVVRIGINRAVIEREEEGRLRVELRMSFDTQLGPFTRTFEAFVY